jgi:hypothetical protein
MASEGRMKWIKPKSDSRYIDSECGRFRINKAGNPPVYQPVRLIPPPSVILGFGPLTLQQAKQKCEEAA